MSNESIPPIWPNNRTDVELRKTSEPTEELDSAGVKDAPFEAATLVEFDFDHRSDKDWAEFTRLVRAHPEWTLDAIARYFAVPAYYAGSLVEMYLVHWLPGLAKKFPESSLEQLLAKVGIFAEEFVRTLNSEKVATIKMHWGSLLRYYTQVLPTPEVTTTEDVEFGDPMLMAEDDPICGE